MSSRHPYTNLALTVVCGGQQVFKGASRVQVYLNTKHGDKAPNILGTQTGSRSTANTPQRQIKTNDSLPRERSNQAETKPSVSSTQFLQRNWHQELRIPKSWRQVKADKGTGVKYQDPVQYGRKVGNYNEVRIMEADPSSAWKSQRVDYVIIKRNGQHYDINGNVVKGDTSQAHIPLNQYRDEIVQLIQKLWN